MSGSEKHKAYGPDEAARDLGVSRETRDRLVAYVQLLLRWNQRINLIGRATEDEIWWRHVLDSGQLAPLLPVAARSVADLGAGAGLPGLILSILNSSAQIHLIESDQRKCAFLREAIRVTQSTAILHESRVEAASLPPQDVIVARALAPLDKLLEMAENLISIHTLCVFPKGARAELELTEARAHWNMQVRQVPSRTDRAGRILILTEVVRARN
ncbi:MAG: 16S rRNA (guanine(527)-N(7))-methyltransferase RsmG [Rhodospirillaceae bacterium]|nr:16S rRNA (guanine(527)-N(7))-methyltransferase RsmG [Rhodospirillaceae bacterium]